MTRMFNFELWAEPPPETVGALCARRAHDWMVIDMGDRKTERIMGNNGNQVLPTFVAADSKGCRVHSARDGKYALHVFTPTATTICHDVYNQKSHADVCFTLRAAMDHAGIDAIPCVLRNTTNSNGGHAMPTIAASEWRGPQGEKDRNGGYVLHRPRRATQTGGGTNPQVCGTLAARDGFKTGPRTPNGQDAYDGKLIVASFDPYEPGGVKTVRQDGAACTVVNGTCAGWHGAVIQFEEAAQ